jgi:hypothetical protein
MSAWHRLVGLVGFLVFLGTGVYLVTSFPELHGGNDGIRYQFRANHVYILLLSSLISGVAGIHFLAREGGWQRSAQRFGSALLLVAPAVLVAAFFLEPPRGGAERPLTTLGMVLLLGGTVMHALARGRGRAT